MSIIVNKTNVLQASLQKFLGNKTAIIGISGGIDSAVVASLCARAIGSKKVFGVQMPYGDQSIEDGTSLIKSLDINGYVVNIKPGVDAAISGMPWFKVSKLTNGNLRARERMSILYAFAGELNGMVIGTGNRTELMIGYFTKYGDGGCDIEPIGSIYKTDVFELARSLGGIPSNIINKAPSAELWENQTDEDEIGMTYSDMDNILSVLENTDKEDYCKNRYALALKYGNDKVFSIEKRVRESEHKRETPKCIDISFSN